MEHPLLRNGSGVIKITFATGETATYRGRALVVDGHLYLIEPALNEKPYKPTAVYAPAVWMSVSVEDSPGE